MLSKTLLKLNLRSARLWLVVILLAAFIIRMPAINYGLPYEYGWDEPEIMNPALRVLRDGIFMPYKFDYGPLNGYLHAAWGSLSFVRGIGKGYFPDGIWEIMGENRTGWYWSVSSPWLLKQARLLSVLLGVVSVALVYIAAFQLWRRILPALWAAAIMALNVNFTGQTTVVSADATTMAAACGCLAASINIYLSRPRWAYITAAVCAAAALSFKYNNVLISVVPILAHLLGRQTTQTGQSKSTEPIWNLLRYFGWLAACSALFMFPVFLQVPRFLHDVSTVLGFYESPADSTMASKLTGYLQRFLALLDMGVVSVPGRAIKSINELGSFRFSWYGIGVVCTVLAGAGYCALKNFRLFALLAPVVLLNLVNVGGDTGFFYPRYLLLSLPFLALFGGLGIMLILEHTKVTPLPFWAKAIFLAALMIPYTFHTEKNVMAARATVDPRERLAAYLNQNVPDGSQLVILDETRWHVTQDQRKRFKIAKSTVPQLLQAPAVLRGADYIIAPRSVYFHRKSDINDALATKINTWLSTLQAKVRFGSEAIAFDGPDVSPAVQLVDVRSLPSMNPLIPDNFIDGIAFSAGGGGGTVLGSGVLGVFPDHYVRARVTVTTDSKQLIVRAQGMSPYHQQEAPEVEVTLTPVNRPSLPVIPVSLNRSLSGLNEYPVKSSIPAGAYEVSLRPRDKNGYMVRVGSVEIKP